MPPRSPTPATAAQAAAEEAEMEASASLGPIKKRLKVTVLIKSQSLTYTLQLSGQRLCCTGPHSSVTLMTLWGQGVVPTGFVRAARF